MRRDGIEITFAAVARAAKVSSWLVYADGVRDYIDAARQQQDDEPSRTRRTGSSASEASLRTDLELVRQDNRALREELTRLKTALRERLGHELEAESSQTLRRRIDQLTEANMRYQNDNTALTRSLDELTGQLRITQDDLAAARGSLRRMIRENTGGLAGRTQ